MSKNSRDYENDELIVHWRPEKCEHCENCINSLPEVFDTKKRPWVNIYGANKERIMEAVALCPTEALTVTDKNPNNEETCPSCHRPLSVCGELEPFNGWTGETEPQCSDRAMEE